MRYGSTLFLSVWMALAALPAAAQHPNVERGFAPGQSFQIGDVDHVNLFNGSLVITIPVGPSYPAGGDLSYGLTLTYSSNVWDHRVADGSSLARPNRFSNAGLGWRLSLGRYVAWDHPDNDLEKDLYIGPDGAEHPLYNTLHAGDADDPGDGIYPYQQSVLYTRDGSYLRAKKTATGWDLEFPDGQVHTFDASGRLTRIANRTGNQVTVTYGANLWTITDGFRTQRVYFQSLPYGGGNVEMVDRVELTAFGTTAAAIYDLSYAQVTISRGCPSQDPIDKTVTVQLLTSVSRPDGSSWQMPVSSYYTTAPQTGTGCRASGAIQALTLPTLGRLEWTWQNYQFPSGSAKMPWRFSSGVATRGLRNPDGTLLGYWSYQTSLTPDAVNGEEKQLVNTVYDPLGNRTVHYFSVYSNEQPGGWSAYDYSLPFTRFVTDGTGRFLSSRVYNAAGAHLRSTYVRYEGDQRWSAVEIQDKTNLNRREASRRTVYEDDTGTYADETLSDFDGLGHYRQRQTGGNFPGSNVRTRVTSYNPGRGTYNQAGFSMLPSTAPWVLGTFVSDQETEGTSTLHRSFCWNAATGELLRQRTHQANSSGQGAGDLIAVNTYASGNLTREAFYGGDVQPVGTSSDLCALALPATPAYQLDHTYVSGVRATSAWSGTTFKTLDLTIDANTGLPSASRDTAGLTATYAYDSLGRPTTVDPSDDALTTYTYRRATSASSLARVTVARVTTPGAVALAESRIDFDAFGRPEREEKLLPDVNGTWAGRKTTYNALGWKTFVSEAGAASTFGTTFELFDPFGRPGKITPADGNAHAVTLAYAGVRQVTRTAKVATSSTAETDASTIEVYDRHGRLYEVTEPNGVKTRYEYDAASRLAKVCQAVTPTGVCGQTRLFNYDNRGFLTSEQHPEKGPVGNGVVSYSSFDARGHAGRMTDGPNDLAFAYDKAERLTLVREVGTGFVDCVNNGGRRCLKTFTFAGSNGTNDFRKGKLQSAARYNHVGNPFNTTVEVRDTYVYGGEEGRVSQKDTQMFLSGTAKEGFRQSWAWNLLGDLEEQTWPDCFATCTPSTPRTVTYGYTKGWLTSVPGFATAISYHPNGLVHQVTHGNGVVFTQQNDPHGMARPASLGAARGTTVLWPAESYTYDGSGNIESIGTTTYLYDSLSRIVDARLPGGASQTYTYDNYGNLTGTNTNGSLQNTPASLTTNRLTGAVSYDAAGNLTSWNGNTSEYDKFNQLVRQKSGAEEWIYIYTADDERFWSYRVGGGGSLWTLRDLSGKAMREYQAHVGWSTFEDYIYRGDQVLAGFLSTGVQRHFDLDHLGTIRLVTNVAGNAVGTHRYYPYGKEQTGLQEADRRKWAGHERDLGSLAGDGDDLDYMHARHYSPVTGRFVSVDPGAAKQQLPQGWNRYAYVLGNPLRYVDPTGRESCPTDECITVVTDLDLSGFYEFLWAGSSFSAGFIDATLSNFSFGLGRNSFPDASFQNGQLVGDGFSIVAGLGEALFGGELFVGGTLLDLTGGGALVGVPVQIAAGGVVVHGGTASALGYVNLMEANRKGGGKTGRKINQKREESIKKQIEQAERGKAQAKTKAEKAAFARQLKHLRGQLKKSETHWK